MGFGIGGEFWDAFGGFLGQMTEGSWVCVLSRCVFGVVIVMMKVDFWWLINGRIVWVFLGDSRVVMVMGEQDGGVISESLTRGFGL